MEQRFKKKNGRRLWLVLPLIALAGAVQAQQLPRPDTTRQVLTPLQMGDSLRVRLEARPDSLVAEPYKPSIDSARLEWLRAMPTIRDLVCDRVGCFETDVPHTFNNSVMAYVTLFTARNRSYMQRVLEREQFYFPIFEKYLAQYNLPTDLKYLAVVESALLPRAKSHVGATGLWQFMGPTAGDLRLKRDEWVDERMHPEKSTEAACKHLRYLYGIFHDWELVLAAYNWGAGSVQRVMRRTGKKTFWDLYPHMPAETRNYVPTFTAIMYSMKYAHLHGLHSETLNYQRAEPLDTLGVRGQAFDLRRLSRACGYADSTYLTRFNPELIRSGLPAGYRPYVVRFPTAARPHLGDVDRATLLTYCQPQAALPQPLLPLRPRLEGVEPFPTRELLAATDGPRVEEAPAAPKARRVRHTVRKGETLATVAEKFDVSPAQLRRWNELAKGTKLKPGRQLLVFVPQPVVAPARPAEAETVASQPVRPVLTADEIALRQAQADANAREAARMQEQLREEKAQAARLAAIQHRQAVQQAAAQAAARAEERRQIQAAREAATKVAAIKPAVSKEPSAKAVADALPAEAPAALAAEAQPAHNGVHTVRKGEYLTKLAREHGVSVAQLVAWNGLTSENVVPGQRLLLRAPAATSPDEAMAATETASAKAAPGRSGADALPKVHLVQPGDTLFNISRRFGVSVDALRKLNKLTTDEVKLGQKLLVPQS